MHWLTVLPRAWACLVLRQGTLHMSPCCSYPAVHSHIACTSPSAVLHLLAQAFWWRSEMKPTLFSWTREDSHPCFLHGGRPPSPLAELCQGSCPVTHLHLPWTQHRTAWELLTPLQWYLLPCGVRLEKWLAFLGALRLQGWGQDGFGVLTFSILEGTAVQHLQMPGLS